jgi:hypothetical protein
LSQGNAKDVLFSSDMKGVDTNPELDAGTTFFIMQSDLKKEVTALSASPATRKVTPSLLRWTAS